MLATAFLALSGCSVFGETGVESAPYSVLVSATDSTIEQPLEIRNYDSMVLVSTSMEDNGRNGAFRRLFNYITGTNKGTREIAMTAPVFMGKSSNDAKDGNEDTASKTDNTRKNNPDGFASGSADSSQAEGMNIEMTAPVFMGEMNTNNGQGKVAGSSLGKSANGSNNKVSGPMMSFVMPASFSLKTTPKPTDPSVIVSELKDYKVAAVTFSWTLSESNVKAHTDLLLNWLNTTDYEPVGEPYTAAYNGPMTLPMYRKNEVLVAVKKR